MSKKDKTLYTDDSIISLNPREFTRLRFSTYLGSNILNSKKLWFCNKLLYIRLCGYLINWTR